MSRIPTTESVRKVYVAAPIITEQNRLNDTDIANNTLAFDLWLGREREAAIEHEYPCDGGCTYDGPEESCSRHGRPVAQVWEMQQAAARAIQSVLELHAPMEALNVRYGHAQQVCTACGTDDGNWQIWPCPTVRLIRPAVAGSSDSSSTGGEL